MRWAKNILLFFCIRRLKPRRERPNNSTGIPGFEEGKKAFRTFYSREGGGVNDCPCVAALTRKASLQRNNGSDRRERPCSGTLSFHPILLSSTQARRFDRRRLMQKMPPLLNYVTTFTPFAVPKKERIFRRLYLGIRSGLLRAFFAVVGRHRGIYFFRAA